jgi:hypothetical protein
MVMISKDIFLRLMELNNVKTLKELSNKFGYTDNWATTTRKREGIPFEACARTAIEKNLSMDFLLFGKSVNNNEIDINELKVSVTEGVFSAIQTDMIILNKDVKISQVTETITSEILDVCNIKDEVRKLNGN